MTVGEDFVIFVVFVNELQRFFDRFRCKVFKIIRNHNSPNLFEEVKRRWGEGVIQFPITFSLFHPITPSSLHLFISLQSFSGRSGRSTCLTPKGARASITALATAGVEPIVPASPTPLAPSGLTVVGVSV